MDLHQVLEYVDDSLYQQDVELERMIFIKIKKIANKFIRNSLSCSECIFMNRIVNVRMQLV
jgi:hypothetical protein